MVDIEVPLTRDVIREPPREFFPTHNEWIADSHAEQIIRSGHSAVAGTTITLYTVPENFTLFITSAWFWFNLGGGGTSGHNHLEIPESDTRLFDVGISSAARTGSLSNNYPMPIRVEANQSIQIRISINGTREVAGGFSGFLLPKKISIR